MMLSMKISDEEGQAWATAFNEVGEQLLGISADELYDLSQVCSQWHS